MASGGLRIELRNSVGAGRLLGQSLEERGEGAVLEA